MANVLLVLPYSGFAFGGGLSIFNAELAKGLVEAGHSVKVLTLQLPSVITGNSAEHGGATILVIPNQESAAMEAANKSAGQQNRERMYQIMKDAVLSPPAIALIRDKTNWKPDFILGHSRFSGVAAIKLKSVFTTSKVAYFMHSFPVEGTILEGYKAYLENISSSTALQKLNAEADAMKGADRVVAVGPLIRAGASKIIRSNQGLATIHVHECVGGTAPNLAATGPTLAAPAMPEAGVPLPAIPSLKLLFLGRASEPIKGFEDLLLAAVALKDQSIGIDVRYWDDKTYKPDAATAWVVDKQAAQSFVDGVLGPSAGRGVRINVLDAVKDPKQEAMNYHAVIMPSYIEHFGLVPFDALSVGVPVLINEASGAALFLADPTRFPNADGKYVVRDFKTTKPRPLRPEDYLEHVTADAFDDRPTAWKAAIEDLHVNWKQRVAGAKALQQELLKYNWKHCGEALIAAFGFAGDTRQGPDGCLQGPDGSNRLLKKSLVSVAGS